jgi:hypothetical protein
MWSATKFEDYDMTNEGISSKDVDVDEEDESEGDLNEFSVRAVRFGDHRYLPH